MALEYFEEYEAGTEFGTKARTVTEATVTEADVANPENLFGSHEPLFMDMEFVKNKGLFDGLTLSGSFTFALAKDLTAQSGMAKDGMVLLGIENMNIPASPRCGDTVRVNVRILEKRETSKPDCGAVTSLTQVLNQADMVFLRYR